MCSASGSVCVPAVWHEGVSLFPLCCGVGVDPSDQLLGWESKPQIFEGQPLSATSQHRNMPPPPLPLSPLPHLSSSHPGGSKRPPRERSFMEKLQLCIKQVQMKHPPLFWTVLESGGYTGKPNILYLEKWHKNRQPALRATPRQTKLLTCIVRMPRIPHVLCTLYIYLTFYTYCPVSLGSSCCLVCLNNPRV